MFEDSFMFGKVNMLEMFGIKCLHYDFLAPSKRRNKIKIPFRHGELDNGSDGYDNRILRLECTLGPSKNIMTRADVRELAYILSKRQKIIMFDEPDKYYMGEIFEPSEIINHPFEVMRDFTIVFDCDPFAYRDIVSTPIAYGSNKVSYLGTAETPTLIKIENIGNQAIEKIRIMAIRKES